MLKPTEVLDLCRNIKPLFIFDPPVSDDEVRMAALQYGRKISGFNIPSKANEAAFQAAVDAVAAAIAAMAPPPARCCARSKPTLHRETAEPFWKLRFRWRGQQPQTPQGSENGFREIEIAQARTRNGQRFPVTRQEKN